MSVYATLIFFSLKVEKTLWEKKKTLPIFSIIPEWLQKSVFVKPAYGEQDKVVTMSVWYNIMCVCSCMGGLVNVFLQTRTSICTDTDLKKNWCNNCLSL